MLYVILPKRRELQITSTVATHLANIFLLHASVTGLTVWWESQKPSVTVPEIFTKLDTVKLFHQADSQHQAEGGWLKWGNNDTLFPAGLKVWKQHKTTMQATPFEYEVLPVFTGIWNYMCQKKKGRKLETKIVFLGRKKNICWLHLEHAQMHWTEMISCLERVKLSEIMMIWY